MPRLRARFFRVQRRRRAGGLFDLHRRGDHGPWWVHVLLWVPLATILTIGLLRVSKALLLALEYRHRAREGRIGEAE
jgi:uncharacterized protein (DUF983 family)